MPSELLRIASWNVNGLRACASKGHFLPWLRRLEAPRSSACKRSAPGTEQLDTVARQPAPLDALTSSPPSAPATAASACSPASAPDLVETSLGLPTLRQSRVASRSPTSARSSSPTSTSPTATASERDNSRVPYKLELLSASSTRGSAELRAAGKRVHGARRLQHGSRGASTSRGPRRTRGPAASCARSGAELSRWLGERVGGHLPHVPSRSPDTTRGGRSAPGPASATSAGGSTTCSPARQPPPSCARPTIHRHASTARITVPSAFAVDPCDLHAPPSETTIDRHRVRKTSTLAQTWPRTAGRKAADKRPRASA
jgi:hypothetical protein